MQILIPKEETRNADLGQSDSVQVERLEYGKFCIEEDGGIVGRVEHQQLGWSADFPPDIRLFCSPWKIGTTLRDLEKVPKDCPHGTVLRPVLLERHEVEEPSRKPLLKSREIIPVLCRVRTRPEDGEGGSGRLYTMARYILAREDGLSPRELFGAINSQRMRGITQETVACPLSTLTTPRPSPPVLDDLTTRFLREAIIYVTSGIPISIVEYVEEDVFFNWVDALWRFLPSALRPLLSAGWGVGESLSGKLTVTYATVREDICAAFYPQEGRWSAPSKVNILEKGIIRKIDFFKDRVLPGLYYVWYVFDCPADSLPEIDDLSQGARAEGLLDPPPLDTYPPNAVAADFDDPATTGVFRRPGWIAYNDHKLEQLRGYLDGAGESSEAGFSPDLTYNDKKREAFKIAFEAMSDPRKHNRAEQIVWGMLKAHGYALLGRFIVDQKARGSSRLRLLAALQEGRTTTSLKALRRAARLGEADDLPGEAANLLRSHLNDSLTKKDPHTLSRCLNLHERLLNSNDIPEAYSEWAKSRDFDLALALLEKITADRLSACGRLYNIAQMPVVYTLWEWAQGKPPTEKDKLNIKALSEQAKRDFGNRLAKRWNEFNSDIADHRENLLYWMKLAEPEKEIVSDPILAMHLFSHTISPDGELTHIVKEVEQNRVPKSLLPLIAEFTLKWFKHLADHLRNNSDRWTEVIKYWPEEVLHALWPNNELPTPAINKSQHLHVSEETKKRIEKAAAQLEISTRQLESLITFWLGSKNKIQPQVSRWHWQWLERASSKDDSPTPVVDICRYFDTGGRCLFRTVPKKDEVEKAIEFAKASGAHDELIRDSQALWRNERDGFYLRLLLEFFPNQEFEPNANKLGALIPHREWLKDHLERKNICPYRKDQFRIATFEPQTLTYPRGRGISWEKVYNASAIWAAFWQVPFKEQGSLTDALKAYCGDDVEKGADLCRRYLNGHTANEYPYALEKVLRDFLLPHLRKERGPDEIEYLLTTKHPRGWATGSGVRKLIYLISNEEKSMRVLKKKL